MDDRRTVVWLAVLTVLQVLTMGWLAIGHGSPTSSKVDVDSVVTGEVIAHSVMAENLILLNSDGEVLGGMMSVADVGHGYWLKDPGGKSRVETMVRVDGSVTQSVCGRDGIRRYGLYVEGDGRSMITLRDSETSPLWMVTPKGAKSLAYNAALGGLIKSKRWNDIIENSLDTP